MVDSTNPRVLADNIKELATRKTGPSVEANPEGAATTDLEKLKVGDEIYGIPEPTSVVANPEDAATADLAKLKVGEVVYAIPVGGVEYSTTEKKIGKWVDGKDLYMITYATDSPPADWNPVNNSGIDIKGFISEASYVDTTSSDGYHRFSMNSEYSGSSVTFIVHDTGTTHGNAHVIISSNGARYRAALTIIYTKV